MAWESGKFVSCGVLNEVIEDTETLVHNPPPNHCFYFTEQFFHHEATKQTQTGIKS